MIVVDSTPAEPCADLDAAIERLEEACALLFGESTVVLDSLPNGTLGHELLTRQRGELVELLTSHSCQRLALFQALRRTTT